MPENKSVISFKQYNLCLMFLKKDQSIHFTLRNMQNGNKFQQKIQREQIKVSTAKMLQDLKNIPKEGIKVEQSQKCAQISFQNVISIQLKFRQKEKIKIIELKDQSQDIQQLCPSQSIKELTDSSDEQQDQLKSFKDFMFHKSYQANIVKDKDIIINKEIQQFPYCCIGMIKGTIRVPIKNRNIITNILQKNDQPTKDKSWIGTGVLLNPFVVLTCAHNIVSMKYKRRAEKLEFIIGNRTIQVANVRYLQIFNDNLQSNLNITNYDYAILLLQSSYVLSKFPTLTSDYDKKKIAQISGFPANKIECGIYNQYGCKDKIENFDKNIFYYNISTHPGQSGSPIIVNFNGLQWFIVGIHTFYDKKLNKNGGIRLNKQNISNIMEWNKLFQQVQRFPISYIPIEKIQIKNTITKNLIEEYSQIDLIRMKIKELQILSNHRNTQSTKYGIMRVELTIQLAVHLIQNTQYSQAIKILKEAAQFYKLFDQEQGSERLAFIYYQIAIAFRKKATLGEQLKKDNTNCYIKHDYIPQAFQYINNSKKMYELLNFDQHIQMLRVCFEQIQIKLILDGTTYKLLKDTVKQLQKKMVKVDQKIIQNNNSEHYQQFCIFKTYICAKIAHFYLKYHKNSKVIYYIKEAISQHNKIKDVSKRQLVQAYRIICDFCFKNPDQDIGVESNFRLAIDLGFRSLNILKLSKIMNLDYYKIIYSQYLRGIVFLASKTKEKDEILLVIDVLKKIDQNHPQLSRLICLLKNL